MGYNVTVARLRGVSILVVMCMHYHLYFPFYFSIYGPLSNGSFGVTAFFVVSGYLITTTMIARSGEPGRVSLSDFYRRRAARIAPPLLLLLALLLALSQSGIPGLQIPDDLSTAQMVWYVLTFRFNIHAIHLGGYKVIAWLVLWSLSIEETFYAGYPLVCRVLRRRTAIILFLLFVIIIGPVDRALSSITFFSTLDHFGCFDAIALGALVALLHEPRARLSPATRRVFMVVGIAVMLTAYLVFRLQDNYVAGPACVAVGAALLLAGSAERAEAERHDPLAFLGKYSYELYLFHLPVFLLLQAASGVTLIDPATAPLVGVSMILLTAAVLVSKLYSEPLNRFIRGNRSPRARSTASIA